MTDIRLYRLMSVLGACVLLVSSVQAVPPTINYQGIATTGGSPFTGHGNFKFVIISEAGVGTTSVWSHDGTSLEGSEPITSVQLTVNNGLFEVELGGENPVMEPLDHSIFMDYSNYSLRMWFNDGVNGFQQLVPDKLLTSSAFAYVADSASDADTVDGLHALEIIDAAASEVRTAISTAPYLIDQPGSYYVTQNLGVTGADDAIRVEVDDVTIDLNGFTLSGDDSSGSYGIYIVSADNVTVRNGTLRDFDDGVHQSSSSSTNNRIHHLQLISNAGNGIWLLGFTHEVTDCMVTSSGEDGIHTQGPAVISGNIARYNGGNGIEGTIHCRVSDNVCMGNSATGIRLTSGCIVTGNTSSSSTGGHGIITESGCTVKGNMCWANTKHGISVDSGCTVVDNTCYQNHWYGIELGTATLVDRNTAYGNNTVGGYGEIQTGVGVYGLNSP